MKEFWGLLEAFNTMAFKREEEDVILRIAAGVLHIGNLEFAEDGDEAKVENMAVLQTAAEGSDQLMNDGGDTTLLLHKGKGKGEYC